VAVAVGDPQVDENVTVADRGTDAYVAWTINDTDPFPKPVSADIVTHESLDDTAQDVFDDTDTVNDPGVTGASHDDCDSVNDGVTEGPVAEY